MSYKAGYVGLIGMPNAGKSTLANALVGEKVAIVTRKAQTTRKRILGIISEEDYQIVLADAPGVISSKKGINGFIVGEYKDVIESSDVLVAVLNLDAYSEEEIEKTINMVKDSGKKCLAVVTKMDMGQIHRAEKIKYKLREMGMEYVETSALKKPEQAKERLVDLLVEKLPEAPGPFYDTDLYTTSTVKQMCEEIIREKCFEQLHDEVPYGLAIHVRKFEEGDKIQKIYADVLIERESHKQIVIGKKGQSLRRIGMYAREDIEKLVGTKVYLELFVKVKEDWSYQKSTMRELGYVNH